ncbi:MAG: AAA domain-containing protein [Chloroflexi bacterium]|nr:AAA domain-containing protein [Chloroflexota bacterium]
MDAFGIVDELISIFESDSELISMAKNAARDVDYADPAFKVLAHDIIYSINYKKKEEIVVENKPKELHSPELKGKRIWLFQPGKKGEFWNDCLSRGIMALNYGDIGDLKNYKSRDEIIADLKLSENSNRNPVFSSLALWQFANEINVGDIILAKGGQIKLLGMGYVMSDYRYTPEFPGYEQVRDVKWENVGEWEIKGINFHIKTITDLTPYPDYVKRIIDAMKLPGSYENYTDEDFLNEVFLSVEQLNSIKRLIRNKKNIIIQGPPGVGKTFLARRLAYVLIGKKDTSRVETIQFHQSYSYEDFVQGIRPTSNGFAIKNGVFYDFCRMAANDKTHDYYFIIDEINRGNLSKILGELMMLIEPDKRGPEYQIQLTYSAVEDEFFVPDNVYIIGMMNTADRSLAMMDYALRRRFSFVTLEPAFETDSFSDYLSRLGVDEPVIQRICRIIGELNNEIQNDSNLGRGFLIGHSYFCSSPNGNIFEWLEDIVECDLCPLIDEYWYDDDAKTRDFKALLRELYE